MTLFDGSPGRQITALAILVYLLILIRTKEMYASAIFSGKSEFNKFAQKLMCD